MTGIVVITWNSGDVIGRCLDACLRLSDVEVTVVDNASSDSTVDEVRKRPGVRLIQNSENRGFAGGANMGIMSLRHPAVLLLNPDAVPLEGVATLAARALNPGVGAAGGRLIGEDGKTQSGFNVRAFPTPGTLAAEVLGLNRILPANWWNRRYRADLPDSAEVDVDQPAGAFLMVNRSAWEAIGGFDEGFFPVWFEDVDFCRRLRNCDYRIVFVPSASAQHIGGHSASRLSWDDRQLFWYGSLLRYAAKHFSAAGRRLVSATLMVACIPRAVIASVAGKGLAAASVYIKVFWGGWRFLHSADLSYRIAGLSSREENRAKQFYS